MTMGPTFKIQLMTKYLIKHGKTIPYHPRANGQTEKLKSYFVAFNKERKGGWIWLGHQIVWCIMGLSDCL